MTFITAILAACDPIIGCISPPPNFPAPVAGNPLAGITALLNNVLKLVFIAAGLYAFFNIVIAGFDFISAGGEPKKISMAWEKIWQTVLGLIIIVSSFLLAAIAGIILFKDPLAILQPKL